jgi:hypothetical protein
MALLDGIRRVGPKQPGCYPHTTEHHQRAYHEHTTKPGLPCHQPQCGISTVSKKLHLSRLAARDPEVHHGRSNTLMARRSSIAR